MRVALIFFLCILAGCAIRVAFTMARILCLTGDRWTAALIVAGPVLIAAALLIPNHPDMEN